MALTVDGVVEKYIALRDKRAALKKDYTAADEPYKVAMEKCENWLLGQLQACGGDSITVKGVGTVFKSRDMKVAGKDWTAFNAWARENNQLELFERRIARNNLAQYMKDHEDEIPPGLDVIFEQSVTVRRNSTKGDNNE